MADYSSIVVSSRIRIARNLTNMKFGTIASNRECNDLISNLAGVISKLGKFKIYQMNALKDIDAEVMVGKHLISKNLCENKLNGAVIVREDEILSIMVNEEDNIREQCIVSGHNLENAYALINEVDDEICDNFDIAFDPKFGYLTSCLTNVGTGMRASVMLFLPALTLTTEVNNIISTIKLKGIAVRGTNGEGSDSKGYLYQVSNAVSIGLSEREIISFVNNAVNKICELELNARKKLFKNNPDLICDMAMRGYGILTNCYSIDYDEFMKLAGEIKLGICFDIIKFQDNRIFDELVSVCTDANLKKLANKNMNEDEINKFRASYLAKVLNKVRVK